MDSWGGANVCGNRGIKTLRENVRAFDTPQTVEMPEIKGSFSDQLAVVQPAIFQSCINPHDPAISVRNTSGGSGGEPDMVYPCNQCFLRMRPCACKAFPRALEDVANRVSALAYLIGTGRGFRSSKWSEFCSSISQQSRAGVIGCLLPVQSYLPRRTGGEGKEGQRKCAV